MDRDTSVATLSLAERYKGTLLAAIGIHPWTATNKTNYDLDRFEQLLDENRGHVTAVGKIVLKVVRKLGELKSQGMDVVREMIW